jgi:hypothetical protein
MEWTAADDRVGLLECRHFFSGAAAYRDESVVASLTPVGLAFKVPTEVRDRLVDSGQAVPLRYFPNSPVKQNYVLFPEGTINPKEAVRLIISA